MYFSLSMHTILFESKISGFQKPKKNIIDLYVTFLASYVKIRGTSKTDIMSWWDFDVGMSDDESFRMIFRHISDKYIKLKNVQKKYIYIKKSLIVPGISTYIKIQTVCGPKTCPRISP